MAFKLCTQQSAGGKSQEGNYKNLHHDWINLPSEN